MNADAIVAEKLSRHFGGFKAVNRISLSVGAGEVFGFLGANGAGKTTAIRMFCGLLAPTSGQGSVAGFNICTQAESVKHSIGYMSQKFSLYQDLTGRENLNFYGSAYGLSGSDVSDRIKELIDRLGLSQFIDRRTGTLPLGWRQRLALAAALLHQPRILFLDEPTGGVDPVFRRMFWNILYGFAHEGVTIFVTTHHMDEAEYCERISIMHRGKIVAMGQPRELVQSHGSLDLQEMLIDLIRQQERNGE